MLIEWEGGKVSDLVADAVVAVLLQASVEQGEGQGPGPAAALDAAMAARAAAGSDDCDVVVQAECSAVAALLGAQFGPTRVDHASGEVHVQVRGVGSLIGCVL